ncbi:MAG: toll/interleukin-1 receptor domain-containing protein [Candidatus Treponema excrementipullorum]|nr:toll/interleukin-1 receptor domain-containing protein [Spirochaetia bacterium]MCI7589131.1 toll/interleukin-1 receptor domain-containing protein [Spirochaetia bacterium]MDD7012299.1 toll/interleukin-1 receptor domain-containing protein [Candidatus Treponema excrementipullorum]MDY4464722.1 toll/interleukin-1 receptor domain-containing protein [Candidatus Treponema excrementipullorum]MDY4708375.1 toll/interleukin-1 receptor domain-containing protein [Candidatus Treponema excrementipullorum]
MKKIFISHNTQDKAVADFFVDFLISIGIKRELIFCSSLPGNNVIENISSEIRESLKTSKVNVVILSNSYYQSPYCLNEAGIIWYKDELKIIIGLPEISIDNMQGFINKDYLIRHLNNSDDIYTIVDDLTKALELNYTLHQVINTEATKLTRKYNEFITSRRIESTNTKTSNNIDFASISTDDEKIILYYMIAKGVRRTSKNDLLVWLQKNEFFNVDINNAFDLLSYLGNSKYENDNIEMDITYFRKFTNQKDEVMNTLKPIVFNHYEKVSNKFINLWQRNIFSNEMKLFLLYTIENKISKLGDRWKADYEINSLNEWVNNNSLPVTVANDYGIYLNSLIANNLVYESEWTSYGNPREYTLYNSLKEFLFSENFPYYSELQELKNISGIPF